VLGFGERIEVAISSTGGICRSRRLETTVPVTRHLHLGLVSPSREHADDFWRTLTEQGFRE
jgi:hypothetical protein